MSNLNRTKVRRLTNNTMPHALPLGELAFNTQTNELFIGTGTGLKKVTNQELLASTIDSTERIRQLEIGKRNTSEKIKNSDLDTSSDKNKIKLLNLSDEVIQAINGNAPVQNVIENGSITTEKYADNSIEIRKLSNNAITKLIYSSKNEAENGLFESEVLDSSTKNLFKGIDTGTFSSFECNKTNPVWSKNYKEGVMSPNLEYPILYSNVNPSSSSGLAYTGLCAYTTITSDLLSYGCWVNRQDLEKLQEVSPNAYLDFLIIVQGTGNDKFHIQTPRFYASDLETLGILSSSSNNSFDDYIMEVVALKDKWSFIRISTRFKSLINTYVGLKWYLRFVNFGPTTHTTLTYRTQGHVTLQGTKVKPYKLYNDTYNRQKVDIKYLEQYTSDRIKEELDAFSTAYRIPNYAKPLYGGNIGNASISTAYSVEWLGFDENENIYPKDTAPVWNMHLNADKSNYTPKYGYIGYSVPITEKTNKYYVSCWLHKDDIEDMPSNAFWCFCMGGVSDSPKVTKENLLRGSYTNSLDSTFTLNGNTIPFSTSISVLCIKDDWVFVVGEFHLKATFPQANAVLFFKHGYTGGDQTKSFGFRTKGHSILLDLLPYPSTLYGIGDRNATLTDVKELDSKIISDHLRKYHWSTENAIWNNALRHLYNTDSTKGENISIFQEGTGGLKEGKITYIQDDLSVALGVPNHIRLEGKATSNNYAPLLSFYASAEDLALLDIIPSNENPPSISTRGIISKSDLLGSNINKLQVFTCLRYGNSDALGNWSKSREVTFVNESTRPNGNGGLGYNEPCFQNEHTSQHINTTDMWGIIHKGIKIPKTVDGLEFCGVVIRLYGFKTVNPGETIALTGVAPAIVKGNDISATEIYLNLPEDFSSTNSTDGPNSNNTISATKRVDLTNVDRITLLGNSYSASHYTMKDKAYVSILSALSDYNWENYSRSGDDIHEIESRIQNGVNDYGLPFKDFNSTYGLILEYTNSGRHRNKDGFYFDNIDKLIRTIQGMGVKPLVATEFLLHRGSDLVGIKDVADRNNAMFMDIYSKSSLFDQRQVGRRYAPFWGNGHPATRNNTLFYHELNKRLDTLPRPNKGLKIYRQRKGTSNSLNNLNYNDNYERTKYWKELSIGHHYLNNPQYYDALNVNSTCGMKVTSEYLTLMKGATTRFNNYALVEIIIPSTSDKVTKAKLMFKGTAGIKVWAKNFIHPIRSVQDYLAFEVRDTVNVNVNDVYSYNNTNYTVIGVYENQIITNKTGNSNPNFTNGTLTKISGSGQQTINFTSTIITFHPNYLNALFKPKGKFEEISGTQEDGYVISEIKNFMDYDKFVFVLAKEGDFSINDIYLEWKGEEGKVNPTKPEYTYFNGVELLPETLLGNSTQLSKWTGSNSLTAIQPQDIRRPYGTEGIIELQEGQYIEQSFTLDTYNPYMTTAINITVWARRFPQIFDPNQSYPDTAPINSDTYDFGEYEVSLSVSSNEKAYVFKKHSCLDWVDEEIRTVIPSGYKSCKIRITCKSKNLQLAKVSVQRHK